MKIKPRSSSETSAVSFPSAASGSHSPNSTQSASGPSSNSTVSDLSFPHAIRTIEGITEYKLENGLTILFLPDLTSQNITVNITYHVGSRQEGLGEAGMAHLLEHLLFKGTPAHPNPKAELQDRGAIYNASTSYDRTNYYETLFASEDNLKFALALEADRMINCWIQQSDLDTEMTVVRNEFEMGENNPVQVLYERMLSAAYQWHNYAKTTIGNRSDIERVAIKNLKKFYQHYYQPDNAVLIIAGNFNLEKAKEWILEYFASIPKPIRKLDQTYTEEPTQDGTRAVTLLRAGEIAHVATAYHIPAASHPDYAVLLILSNILSNEPSGLLFQSFVQTGKASHISMMVFGLKEPGMIFIALRPTQNNQAKFVLKELIHQLETLNETIITQEQVERAKARILKHIKMTIMNSSDLALELSESIAQGDYRLFFHIRDLIKTITVDDVVRVALSYFMESNRTTGLFIPTPHPTRCDIPPTPNLDYLLESYTGSEDIHLGDEFEATPESIDAHTIRNVLAGTIKTSILAKSTRGHANQARLVFHFGNEKLLEHKLTELHMLPDILRRGTKTLSLQQIQDKLDKLQSTLKLYAAHAGAVALDITSDKHHLSDTIILASEIMRSPDFSSDEFSIVRQRELTDWLKASTDPIHVGMRELERMLNPFPNDSIHYVHTFDEIIENIKNITLEKMQLAYKELYGANHLEVSIVGDVDPSIHSIIEDCFGKWKSLSPYQLITQPFVPALNESRTIIIPDKQMAIAAMGINFSMRDDDVNYPALRVANHIFGESMKSRLMHRLRETEGLSYDAGSSLDVNRHDSAANLSLHALCATDKIDLTLQFMKEEYYLWIEKGVTEQELQECKQSIQLYFKNMLTDDHYVLHTLSSMIDVNRTFGFYAQLLSAIEQVQIEDIKRVLETYLAHAPIATVRAGSF